MKNRKLLIAAALLFAVLLFTVGVTTSLLTDVERQTNVITIGNVKVTLDEGEFDPDEEHPVVSGSRVKKAPKLTNDGSRDEFVFIKLTVPKAGVTLLYEEDVLENSVVKFKKGAPRLEKGTRELFRFIADDTHTTGTVTFTGSDAVDTDITFHSGSDSEDGWIFIKSDLTDEASDVYVFGYNRRLAPTEETVTLFDEVQLKSFIDGEVKGDSAIGVECFGIQAKNLETSASVDWTAERFSSDDLLSIYTIVENKTEAP